MHKTRDDIEIFLLLTNYVRTIVLFLTVDGEAEQHKNDDHRDGRYALSMVLLLPA
jgi:hypothetical protein